MPSLCLTSADFFSSLILANTDGYHSDKTEKKNVEPGECRPEPLGKLAAAVVSLNNETPEWLEHNLSFVSESVLGKKRKRRPAKPYTLAIKHALGNKREKRPAKPHTLAIKRALGTKREKRPATPYALAIKRALGTEEKERPHHHAARLLTQDCNTSQLLDIHSRLPRKPRNPDARRISTQFIRESFPHYVPKREIKLAIKNAESLGPFIRSLDFERCLDLPNYMRLPSCNGELYHSLDLFALDEEGKKRLDALGPEAKEILNSSDPNVVKNLVASDPQWKEFIDYLESHSEDLFSFEGTKFLREELDLMEFRELSWSSKIRVRINPISDRFMDKKQEFIKKMTASIKDACTSFLWDASALKADLFSGNDTDMATRFPLSFVLEQAFDYPDKRTGFKVASKVMNAVSQQCKNSSVNSNYLFNQAVNSLLCMEKFWRHASSEWRDLLIKSDVFPIDALCPGPDDDAGYPLDRSPLFLACRFSPYASDIQALFEAGASPNQLCTLKDNGSVCEWSAELAGRLRTLGAVSCLMLKHSEIPQVEEKLDQFLNDPDFANIPKMGVPLHLAIFKGAPASMVEKLVQHPDCDVHWLPPEGMCLPGGGKLYALELAIQKALFDHHDSQDVCSGQSNLTGSTNGSIGHWTEVIQALARQGAGRGRKGTHYIRWYTLIEPAYERNKDNGYVPSEQVFQARKQAIQTAIEKGWAEKDRKERRHNCCHIM